MSKRKPSGTKSKRGVPGSRWRVLATDDKAKGGQVRLENQGVFDELVVDNWIHLEQMNDDYWWMQLGEHHFHIVVDKQGYGKVTFAEDGRSVEEVLELAKRGDPSRPAPWSARDIAKAAKKVKPWPKQEEQAVYIPQEVFVGGCGSDGGTGQNRSGFTPNPRPRTGLLSERVVVAAQRPYAQCDSCGHVVQGKFNVGMHCASPGYACSGIYVWMS